MTLLESGNCSKKRILAWKSRKARKTSGPSGYTYQDRPVRKSYWEKVDDHPVPGLALFRIPEPENQ